MPINVGPRLTGYFIKINGHQYPYPGRDLTFKVATIVDSARNTNGVVVGQRVGRDNAKIDSLEWKILDAITWSQILQEFENFYVTVEYPDMVTNNWKSVKMYPGDRSAKVWKIDPNTGLPSEYVECKVNLIDVGE